MREVFYGVLAFSLDNDDTFGGQKMIINVIELVIWLIAGILVMLNGRNPTKFEYVLVWGCLLLNVVGRIINK